MGVEECDRIRRRRSRNDSVQVSPLGKRTREELPRDFIARNPEAVLFRKYPIGVRGAPRLIHVRTDQGIIGDGFELLPVSTRRLIDRGETPQFLGQ